MFVDRFCQKFAGEDTLSLLRCMAVANGNPKKIEYQIFQLHLPLQNVAAYFQSKPAAPKNQKAINAFFGGQL